MLRCLNADGVEFKRGNGGREGWCVGGWVCVFHHSCMYTVAFKKLRADELEPASRSNVVGVIF